MKYWVPLSLVAALLATPAFAQRPGSETRAPSRYLAAGPTEPASLGRLRTALEQLESLAALEISPAPVGAILEVRGEASVSLLNAAAQRVGYSVRSIPVRSYAAEGSTADSDRQRLHAALAAVPGVDQVALGAHVSGAALRVRGIATPDALRSAGRKVGYTLRAVGAYTAAGPSESGSLARLHELLSRVPGVESLEWRALAGGATFVIWGDAEDERLVAAAEEIGYSFWPLGDAQGPRRFRVAERVGAAEESALRSALERVERVSEIEIRRPDAGPHVVLVSGRAREERVIAAARAVGIDLVALAEPVTLPTVAPQADRNTPPDYDERVLEEQATLGEPAPAFSLVGPDGERRVSLAEFRGKRPVVLVFGSCTCPPFRAMSGSLEQLYRTYRDRAEFLFVYIREAHPGSILPAPTADGGTELRVVPQASARAERVRNFRQFMALTGLSMPAVLDNETDDAKRAYAAWPIRLYVVGVDGRVAFKSGPGPTGFKLEELEDWLREHLP